MAARYDSDGTSCFGLLRVIFLLVDVEAESVAVNIPMHDVTVSM